MPKVKRGPKPKTAANSRPSEAGGIWSDYPAPESLTPGASIEFDRLVEVLRRAGTLEKTDYEVVVNAARIKDLVDQAYEDLATSGLTVLTENNAGAQSVKSNPLLAIINSLTMRHRAILNDLGLTPASAKLTSVATSPAQVSNDPLQEFLVVG